MNRQELIDAPAAPRGEKAATADLLSAAPEIVGFDPLSQGQGAARTGRNPAPGAEIKIAAARTAKFTAGKTFWEAVNAS